MVTIDLKPVSAHFLGGRTLWHTVSTREHRSRFETVVVIPLASHRAKKKEYQHTRRNTFFSVWHKGIAFARQSMHFECSCSNFWGQALRAWRKLMGNCGQSRSSLISGLALETQWGRKRVANSASAALHKTGKKCYRTILTRTLTMYYSICGNKQHNEQQWRKNQIKCEQKN